MQYPAQSNASNTLTIAQLTISGLGMAFSLLLAVLLALVGFIGLMGQTIERANITALFGLAWVCLLAAGAALPSVILSVQRIRGQKAELPRLNSFRLASLMLLVWPLLLALGNLLSGTSLAWLILPPIQLLAFGIPVWWFVEVARRKLPFGSQQRGWGVINFSLFITTPLVIVVELLVIILLFVLGVLWLSSQPALVSELERLAERILAAPEDPEAILELARPYLQNPLVIFGTLGLLGGLMPLIEELLKPLALWALIRRRLTPAEGFVAGAMCGAAFGLLESLLNLSGPIQDGWAILVVGRAGTGLLHIVSTALVGWAMASAWTYGFSFRPLLTFLLAVGLHGIWNVFSVLSGLSIIFDDPTSTPPLVGILAQGAPIGIILLVLILFVILWGSNRQLQRETIPSENTVSDRYQQPYALESSIHGNDSQSH